MKISTILLAVLVSLLLSACGSTDPNEQFIQGKWMTAGQIDEEHSWYLEWTFDKGLFEVNGYPPLHQTGKYQVMDSQGDTITLQLTNQKGDWPTDNKTIIVIIDSANKTLMIDGQGPYSQGD